MRNKIILLLLLAMSMVGCKQDNWMDWKAENEAWLIRNGQQEGVKTLPSGLQYRILADECPQDARPNSNSNVIVDYTGRLINGQVFDSGNKVELSLAGTVAGFTEGLRQIHNNGDIEIYIPCELGYTAENYPDGFGTEGSTRFIPPYSVLIFKIHLCSVN